MEFFEDIFLKPRGMALSVAEKAAGRDALLSQMLAHPIRVRSAVASAPMFSLRRVAGVTTMVGTLVLSAGGVSYAAEGAMPGDALYGVKVGFNEQVSVALALSQERKAEVEAERADRRLAEAETLAQRGTLTADTRVALETKFKEHAESAKKRIEQVRGDDEAGAEVLEAHFEGSLSAHRKIIAAIAAQAESDADFAGDGEARSDATLAVETDPSAVTLANATVSEKGAVTQKPSGAKQGYWKRRMPKQDYAGSRTEAAALAIAVNDAVTTALAQRDNASAHAQDNADMKAVKKQNDAQRAVAQKMIADARAALASMRVALGEEAYAEAEARLLAAEAEIGSGDGLLLAPQPDAQSYFQAITRYARAQRIAQEARLLMRARTEMKIDVRMDDPSDPPQPSTRQETRSSAYEQRTPPTFGGDVLQGAGDLRDDDGRESLINATGIKLGL